MARIRKSPSHLLRVGTTYHFRYSIPRQHQRFVSGEVRVSLGTGSLKTARIKAAKLTSLTESFLANVEKGNLVIENQKDIKAALGRYLRDILEKHELGRLDGPAKPLRGSDAGKLVNREAMLTCLDIGIMDQLKGRENKGTLDVTGFLESAGLNDIPNDSLTYKYAHRELLKLCQAVIRIEQERMKGNYNSQVELSILANYPVEAQQVSVEPAKKKRRRSMRLSKAINKFLSENISDRKWAPKSIVEYQNRLGILLELMGDCLLSEIDFDKTRQFFDGLKKLPPNRNKIKEYRDKSIPELLKMKLPREKCMSARTVNNTMQAAYSFFDWAVQRDIMKKNYAGGMRVKQSKQPFESKEHFGNDDLKRLFASMTKKDAHRFWVPLVGLYTGARLEEICQLHIDDIRQEDGVWIIDINDSGDKRLKTLNAKRIVPIHKSLIDEGFIDYVRQMKSAGKQRIFPELKRIKGKYGHYFSRAFSLQLKKLGIKTEGRSISFHSLRHSFITRAKHTDLPEGYIKQIVGHANQSITFGLYGKNYDVPKLKEIIDLVVFDID
jgi:integrase